jgi:uncharacterized protein (UPF0248 family)
VQVYNAVPTVHAQFWPARFTDEPSDEPTSSVQGFYLIGLSAGGSSAQKNTSIPASVLRMFEDDCYKNARFYDPAEAFISVTEVSRDELSEAVSLDPHQWSDNNIDGEESDEEDKEETDSDSEDEVEVETSAAVSKNQKRRAAKAKSATPFLPAQKLRTSADVYHRLIWDHNDKEEYVIGYEDRFKGVREMPMRSWKREVEDEAFVRQFTFLCFLFRETNVGKFQIPFHRVVHFRRKSDGVLVWDRRTKTDLVFGSGVLAS